MRALVRPFVMFMAAICARTACAQPIVTTVVGRGETIAVAVDAPSHTIYFATDRPGAIYKVTGSPSSPALVAGLPGGSIADGVAAAQAAVFPARNGLAVDAGGNLFFSEPSLHRIRRIDSATGLITTIAGTGSLGFVAPTYFDANNAVFTDLAAPEALAFNRSTGDLFVADEAWDVVYRISGNGSPITSSNGFLHRAVGGDLASTSIFVDFNWYNPFGYLGDNGPALDAKLNRPRGLAFDASGNLYIADTGNNVVRRVDGNNIITTFAGNGTPGHTGDFQPAAAAQLFMPTGLVASADTLYIADTSNHVIRTVDLNTGQMGTWFGDGVARFGSNSLAFPTGVDLAGNALVIADSQNRSIAFLDPISDAGKQEIAFVATANDPGYVGDGAPGGDALNQPMSVVFDAGGNAFFSDSGNSRVRRIDAVTHAVTTVAGNGIPGYAGDNGDARHAMLNCPAGLAFGAAGDLFIADTCANVVRKVAPGADGLVTGAADEIITTFAGTGVRYEPGDGGGGPATAARLNAPVTLAVGPTGTLLIGEPDVRTIRSVAPGGTIDSGTSDTGSKAFTVDAQGHFILADDVESDDIECNGQQIVSPANLGLVVGSWAGAAIDSLGRLYLSEDQPHMFVYRFGPSGGGSFCSGGSIGVSVIAGTGSIGYSGDGGSAASATLNHPEGMAVDGSGNLWLADAGNNVIRRVEQPVVGVTVSPVNHDFGTQSLQTATVATVVTATSSGSLAATFAAATLAGANPGDFTIVADACGGAVVAVGGNCQISVAFKPTAAGPRAATLQVNDNAGGSPQTVTLSGTGVTLGVAPSALSFGSQTQSVTSAATLVTVTNQAAAALTMSSLSFTGSNAGDFAIVTDGCSGVALATRATCTFGVTFTPQALGPRSATLNIASSAGDSPRTIDASGTGTPPFAAAHIAPSLVAFGQATVGSRSSPVTITLTSSGTGPLSIASAALTGNQTTDFVLSADSCSGATLAPTQSCTVTATFAPGEICSSTAAVSFTDNASDSPQAVPLSGQAVSGPGGAFQAALFCTSHAAQPQELAAGPDGSVWFDERGSVFAPGAIARASASAGVFREDPTVVQSGWHPSGLVIAPDGSYAYLESRAGGFSAWFDVVNPAGAKGQTPVDIPGPNGVGPDGGFWLTNRVACGDTPLFLHYVPNGDTVSVTPDLVWIFNNTNGKSCLAPSVVASGPDGTMWIGSTNQGPDVGTNAPNGFVRVSLNNELIDFTPTSAAPMAATVGSDGNLYALIANLGVSACSLVQIDALGHITPIPTDPSLIELGCFSIATGPDNRIWSVGLTHTFTGTIFEPAIVAYDPVTGLSSVYPTLATSSANSYLTAGPDEGIWFDAVPSAVARFDIGGGPSAGYVTPKVVGFPSTMVGLPSAVRTVTVRSTGSASLTIASVSITGADAAQFIMSDKCSGAVLQPGSTCVVMVASRPTTPGSHAAKLLITDSDGFSPQIVRLAEFSLPAVPTASPASVSFPSAIVGKHGTTATITLTNHSDRALAVRYPTLGGTNSGDFSTIGDTCTGASVPPGGTCGVTVRFDPTAAGTRTATLTFTDAANPPTQTVTLRGTGQTAGSSGGGGGSSSCDCDSNGLFVDPASVYPLTGASSPGSKYTLNVLQSQGRPSAFQITGKNGPVATIPAPANATWPLSSQHPWGFSPDDDRFVLHYATFASNGATTTDWIDNIALFDLKSSTPGVAVRTLTLPIAPQGSATGPAGSMAFSADGAYLLTVQIQTISTGQTMSLDIVAANGSIVFQDTWSPAAAAADPNATAGSSFWGFAPDQRSFAYYRQTPGDDPILQLIDLPSGTPIRQLHFGGRAATYVQFAPCGEVLAVVDQVTDPFAVTADNPVTITLYSTRLADAGKGAIGTKSSLPVGDIQIDAGPGNYTATVQHWPDTIVLGPNAATGSCPAPTTTSDAGGSDAPKPAVAPSFKSTFPLDAPPPPRIGTVNQLYSYTFEADGSPAPTFAFLSTNCSFLTIDQNTGEVSGTPAGAFVCSYSVTASNGAGYADAGPFVITIEPAPPQGGAFGGPYEGDDYEPAPALPRPMRQTAAPSFIMSPSRASSDASSSGGLPPAVLLLPHGRGQILLPSDVTPSISTFTYTEGDGPSTSLAGLTFAGLDFTITAVDAATGVPVTTLVDPPVAAIAIRNAEVQAARIVDVSTISVFWWSGTAWVNQMPCAGCGLNAATSTLKVSLSKPGEYVLAAAQPPRTLTVTAVPITAIAGSIFSGSVASFAPIAPADPLGNYAAIVRWGDGQVSQGLLSASGSGAFVVSGSHTWNAVGHYDVGVTVLEGGTIGVGDTTAVVTSSSSAPPLFTAATPPLTATVGAPYAYTFAASGTPAPSFALGAGAPAFLTIAASSGAVSGTPPAGTTSFTYNVVASNGVSPDATAGPFVVTVASSSNKSADLAVVMTAPATAAKGSIVTYTMVVTNNGPSPATDGTLLLLVGADAAFVSASPTPLVSFDGLTTWTFRRLDPRQSLTYTLRLKLTRAGTVAAIAGVASEVRDPRPADNVAIVKTTVR